MSLALSLVQAPRAAWARYLSILESKPARTKIATSITAAFIGDMIAQRMDRSHLNAEGTQSLSLFWRSRRSRLILSRWSRRVA